LVRVRLPANFPQTFDGARIARVRRLMDASGIRCGLLWSAIIPSGRRWRCIDQITGVQGMMACMDALLKIAACLLADAFRFVALLFRSTKSLSS